MRKALILNVALALVCFASVATADKHRTVAELLVLATGESAEIYSHHHTDGDRYLDYVILKGNDPAIAATFRGDYGRNNHSIEFRMPPSANTPLLRVSYDLSFFKQGMPTPLTAEIGGNQYALFMDAPKDDKNLKKAKHAVKKLPEEFKRALSFLVGLAAGHDTEFKSVDAVAAILEPPLPEEIAVTRRRPLSEAEIAALKTP